MNQLWDICKHCGELFGRHLVTGSPKNENTYCSDDLETPFLCDEDASKPNRVSARLLGWDGKGSSYRNIGIYNKLKQRG